MSLAVGDVLCTRNARGWPARMIRLGAALLDRPNTVNHVIVVHHQDKAGTWWGIEGRPGGVGWVDLRRALRAPYTLDNRDQPKTDAQRAAVARVVKSLLGTPYDWTGIVEDGMRAVNAPRLWASRVHGDVPAQIVCSSLADWVYDKVGLPSPGEKFDRNVTPADWAAFIVERAWRS